MLEDAVLYNLLHHGMDQVEQEEEMARPRLLNDLVDIFEIDISKFIY